MTTHDMQPETANPAVRTDRPAEPRHMSNGSTETADATGGFRRPTRDVPRRPPRPMSHRSRRTSHLSRPPSAAADTGRRRAPRQPNRLTRCSSPTAS